MSTTTILQSPRLKTKESQPGVIRSFSSHHTTSPALNASSSNSTPLKEVRMDLETNGNGNGHGVKSESEEYSDVNGSGEDSDYTETEEPKHENGEVGEADAESVDNDNFRDEDYGPAPASSGRSLAFWAELDTSIILALISPIGHYLTGGDHIKNLFLIVLLIFYLHQLIQVPWELYKASLPRQRLPNLGPRPKDISSRALALAESELSRHQTFYLILTLATPLLGALLLQYGLSSISDTAISWFSITLFVLATGIRPWTHFIGRLRKRTNDLHDEIVYHHPSPESPYLVNKKLLSAAKRVSSLERELELIKNRVTAAPTPADNTAVVLDEVYDDLGVGLEDVERKLERSLRKSEAVRISQEKRLAALEQSLAFLLEERRRNGMYGNIGGTASVIQAMMEAPRNLWSYIRFDHGQANGHVRATQAELAFLQEKVNGKRRLDTIPEDPADGATASEDESTPLLATTSKLNGATAVKSLPVTAPPSSSTVISGLQFLVAAMTWPLRLFIAISISIQRRVFKALSL